MATPGLVDVLRRLGAVWAVLLALAACGGGGGDADPPPDPGGDGPSYTLSVTVEGLERRIELRMEYEPNNNVDLSLRKSEYLEVGNGTSTFTTRLPAGWEARIYLDGDLWRRPAQGCMELFQDGQLGDDSIYVLNIQADTQVRYRCGRGYALGGTVTGEIDPPYLRLEAGTRTINFDVSQFASVHAAGSFSMDPHRGLGGIGGTPILPGTPYFLDVWGDPACRITNGAGIMPDRDVEDVLVDCRRGTELRFKVSGMRGTRMRVGSTLTQPGSPQFDTWEGVEVLADGDYRFRKKAYPGAQYSVGVGAQPVAPSQECVVLNGEGTVENDEPITNIEVRCPGPEKTWRYDGLATMLTETPFHDGDATWEVVDEYFEAPERAHPGLGAGIENLGAFTQSALYQNLFAKPGTNMAVYSSDDGVDYRIATEAADGSDARITWLRTRWWLRKNSPATDVRFVLSHLYLDAWVDNNGSGNRAMGELNARGAVELRAHVVSPSDGSVVPVPFHAAIGHVNLQVNRVVETAQWFAQWGNAAESTQPVFLPDSFEPDLSRTSPTSGGVGFVKLREPIRLAVDLSSVAVGQRVMVEMVAAVQAQNGYSFESHAVAYLRDPATFDAAASDGGVKLVAMEGVSITEPGTLPAGFAPQPDTTPAPACAAPGAPRATLQFAAATFSVSENDPTNRSVTVTRTGSSAGALTAKVRVQPGTATPGLDYRAGDVVVRFADGDASPRTVNIPVLQDALVESPETLLLTLADVSGCADAGPQATATVTLLDDEPPAVAGPYTIGGTVTGLAGSGLVIEAGLSELAITANGAFQFGQPFAAGVLYRVIVKSQPQNPRQVCEVINGQGTATANVTNVQVTCTTLPEPGSLDPAFGTGGRAFTTLMGAWPPDTQLALQPDGKLLVVGGNSGLLRLLPGGTPDASFGPAGTGLVTVTSGQRDPHKVTAVALQPDGRIVVAGYSRPAVGRTDFLVARYHADGTLDTSFAGGAGIATFDYRAWNDGAHHLLVQADGSILLVGSVSDAGGNGDSSDFAVLRLTAGGQIDTAYGTGGWARTNVAGRYDVPRAAVLTPDGGVVLVGRVAASGGANADVGIVKFTAAGVPDAAFGPNGNGIVRPLTSEHDEARDVVLLADGSLLVAGERRPSGGLAQLWLARYSATGQLDTTFGSNGLATPHTPFAAYALAVRADGSFWVAGDVNAGDGIRSDYGLARFTATGQPDATFNGGAVLALDLFGGFDTPGAMLLQPDGKVVIAGAARNGSTGGLGLVRVLP